MSAFSILGKLTLDTTAFMRSLMGAKNAVTPAANQIGQQFKGKLLEALGAAGLIATTKKALKDAFDIRNESGRLGIETGEFQTLKRLSDETGESVDSLAERLRIAKLDGSDFATGIKEATDELHAMGLIVDSGTIDKLADLFQKIADLAGRMAPGIAFIVDKLLRFHEIGSRAAEGMVGSAMVAYGKMTGNKTAAEAGREMESESVRKTKSDESRKGAVERIKERIAKDRDVEQWWKDVGGDEAQKDSKKRSLKSERPSASSLTQVGGYMTSTASNARRLDGDVKDIKNLVNSLVSLYRQKE